MLCTLLFFAAGGRSIYHGELVQTRDEAVSQRTPGCELCTGRLGP